MPEIGYYHPQLVHFAIVFCGLGVAFRLASLTGRFPWTNPTAAILLIGGALAAWLTAQSGIDAHGPVERIPGLVEAVTHHEDWGIRARNTFLIIGAIELIALFLKNVKAVRTLRLLTGVGGLAGLAVIYEAADHGGDLVYEYGGGPGLRSGDPEDLTRLLVAGLYTRAMADRTAGDKDGAARLIDELGRRMPNDPAASWVVIESRIKDRGDAAGALEALRQISPAADDRRGTIRKGVLTADAYKALGQVDSARAVLEGLRKQFPEVRSIATAIENLSKP